MGFDIIVSDPENNNFQYYHLSNNRSNVLCKYVFYTMDFNGKTVKDVLLCLNTVIFKLLEAGAKPLNRDKYPYDEGMDGATGNIIYIRNELEEKAGLDWFWYCD